VCFGDSGGKEVQRWRTERFSPKVRNLPMALVTNVTSLFYLLFFRDDRECNFRVDIVWFGPSIQNLIEGSRVLFNGLPIARSNSRRRRREEM